MRSYSDPFREMQEVQEERRAELRAWANDRIAEADDHLQPVDNYDNDDWDANPVGEKQEEEQVQEQDDQPEKEEEKPAVTKKAPAKKAAAPKEDAPSKEA